MSYGGWSGSLCCRVIRKLLSFEGKTLVLSSSAEYFQCLIWSSIAMSLTHLGAGLKQLLKLKKGAKKRNGNLGYEEATNTLKNEWASSRWPTPASPVSSHLFPSPFPFVAAGLQSHFQVVWFSHLGVLLHELNDPWLCEAWLCGGDVSHYSFYKSKFKYRCTWTQCKLLCLLSMHLSWVSSSCFVRASGTTDGDLSCLTSAGLLAPQVGRMDQVQHPK